MCTLKLDKLTACFLDLVAWSEGTDLSCPTQNRGYTTIVEGVNGANSFTDFSAHPFASNRPLIVVRNALPVEYEADPDNPTGPPRVIHGAIPQLLSSASGRYQITLPTWREISERAGLHTFSPPSQDSAALTLITQCKANFSILAKSLPLAFQQVSNTWASFPGNLYGQPTHTPEELIEQYTKLLAAWTPQP